MSNEDKSSIDKAPDVDSAFQNASPPPEKADKEAIENVASEEEEVEEPEVEYVIPPPEFEPDGFVQNYAPAPAYISSAQDEHAQRAAVDIPEEIHQTANFRDKETLSPIDLKGEFNKADETGCEPEKGAEI